MCRNHDRCKNDLPNVFVCTASHSYLTTCISSTTQKLEECSTEGVEFESGVLFFFHFKLSFRTFDADCLAKLLFTILLISISIIDKNDGPGGF